MLKKCISFLCVLIMFVSVTASIITTNSNLATAEAVSQQASTSQNTSVQDIEKIVPDLIKSDAAPFGEESKDATEREDHIIKLQTELYGCANCNIYRYDPVYDVTDSENTSTNPTIKLGTSIMKDDDYASGVAFDPNGSGTKNYVAYVNLKIYGANIIIASASGSNRKIMATYTLFGCSTSTELRRCLVAGDFNGDGKETIVFAGYYLDNTGKETNITELSYDVKSNKITAIGADFISVNTPRIRAEDINKDGYSDLIVIGIHSEINVIWGGDGTSFLGDSTLSSKVVDNYTLKCNTKEGNQVVAIGDDYWVNDECIDCVMADFDGTGETLWVVQKIQYFWKGGSADTHCKIYKTVCKNYKITLQPLFADIVYDGFGYGFLTVDEVYFDGKDQRSSLFMDGALYKWNNKEFAYVGGDKTLYIESYAIGNFTCDASNREQVVYTQANSLSTKMLFYNGGNFTKTTFSNVHHALIAIDDDNDCEIVKFNDKFFAYSEPEVFGILQASPYYKELNERNFQDVGWTQFTIGQSFTTSETQSSGKEKTSGI